MPLILIIFLTDERESSYFSRKLIQTSLNKTRNDKPIFENMVQVITFFIKYTVFGNAIPPQFKNLPNFFFVGLILTWPIPFFWSWQHRFSLKKVHFQIVPILKHCTLPRSENPIVGIHFSIWSHCVYLRATIKTNLYIADAFRAEGGGVKKRTFSLHLCPTYVHNLRRFLRDVS